MQVKTADLFRNLNKRLSFEQVRTLLCKLVQECKLKETKDINEGPVNHQMNYLMEAMGEEELQGVLSDVLDKNE